MSDDEQILKPKTRAPRKMTAAAKEKKIKEIDEKFLEVADKIRVAKATPPSSAPVPEPKPEPVPEPKPEPTKPTKSTASEMAPEPVKAPRKKKVIQIVQLESDSDSEVELVMPKTKKVAKKVVASEPPLPDPAPKKSRTPRKPKEPKEPKEPAAIAPIQQVPPPITRIKFL